VRVTLPRGLRGFSHRKEPATEDNASAGKTRNGDSRAGDAPARLSRVFVFLETTEIAAGTATIARAMIGCAVRALDEGRRPDGAETWFGPSGAGRECRACLRVEILLRQCSQNPGAARVMARYA